MWELMNGMANGIRGRMAPRRNNGLGTMTAMVIGASVGIAAWETLRRSQPFSRMNHNGMNASEVAQSVMDQLDE